MAWTGSRSGLADNGIDPCIEHNADASTIGIRPNIGQVRRLRLCLEEAAASGMVSVLDIAPDGTCLEKAGYKIIRFQVIAGLEICGDGNVHRRCDLAKLSECGLGVAVAVRATPGGRHGHARCGHDRAAAGNDGLGTGRVPHVGQHQGPADLVEFTQPLGRCIEASGFGHRYLPRI